MKYLSILVLLLTASLAWASDELAMDCSGKDTFLRIQIGTSPRVVNQEHSYKVTVWTFDNAQDLADVDNYSLWNWDYVVPTSVEYLDDQEPIEGKNYDFWVDSEDKLSINVYDDDTADGKRLNTDTGGIETPLSCTVLLQ